LEQKKTIIEYKNCIVSDKNKTLPEFSISIEENDVIEISASDDETASLFIRGLSTLVSLKGEIFFKEDLFNTLEYEKILELKRNIAYIGPLCALLSNRSLIENILLFRLWEENSRKIRPDSDFMEDCERAGISEYLYQRPEKATEEVKCGAYLVREFLKNPLVIYMERPYLFTRGRLDRFLCEKLNKASQMNVPVVFFSTTGFVPSFRVTHKIIIEEDKIEKVRVKNGS
jgi:ABC-type ATPase involved in cell division